MRYHLPAFPAIAWLALTGVSLLYAQAPPPAPCQPHGRIYEGSRAIVFTAVIGAGSDAHADMRLCRRPEHVPRLVRRPDRFPATVGRFLVQRRTNL